MLDLDLIVVGYRIVSASSTKDLAKKVSRLLPDGWQPFCQVFSTPVTCVTTFYQAMVAYGDAGASTGPATASCHANRDGDCDHEDCPQLRDGEPGRTGRDCPLLGHEEDEE